MDMIGGVNESVAHFQGICLSFSALFFVFLHMVPSLYPMKKCYWDTDDDDKTSVYNQFGKDELVCNHIYTVTLIYLSLRSHTVSTD